MFWTTKWRIHTLLSLSLLTIHVKATGGPFTLVLNAVANPATGGALGDTSLFQGQADWLKSVDSFAGTVEGIAIRWPTILGIKFNFPAGFPRLVGYTFWRGSPPSRHLRANWPGVSAGLFSEVRGWTAKDRINVCEYNDI